MPNLNQVASMDLALTDATGSGADLVPVAIRPLQAARNTSQGSPRAIRLSADGGSAGANSGQPPERSSA
jgi:hypothetical protein